MYPGAASATMFRMGRPSRASKKRKKRKRAGDGDGDGPKARECRGDASCSSDSSTFSETSDSSEHDGGADTSTSSTNTVSAGRIVNKKTTNPSLAPHSKCAHVMSFGPAATPRSSVPSVRVYGNEQAWKKVAQCVKQCVP